MTLCNKTCSVTIKEIKAVKSVIEPGETTKVLVKLTIDVPCRPEPAYFVLFYKYFWCRGKDCWYFGGDYKDFAASWANKNYTVGFTIAAPDYDQLRSMGVFSGDLDLKVKIDLVQYNDFVERGGEKIGEWKAEATAGKCRIPEESIPQRPQRPDLPVLYSYTNVKVKHWVESPMASEDLTFYDAYAFKYEPDSDVRLKAVGFKLKLNQWPGFDFDRISLLVYVVDKTGVPEGSTSYYFSNVVYSKKTEIYQKWLNKGNYDDPSGFVFIYFVFDEEVVLKKGRTYNIGYVQLPDRGDVYTGTLMWQVDFGTEFRLVHQKSDERLNTLNAIPLIELFGEPYAEQPPGGQPPEFGITDPKDGDEVKGIIDIKAVSSTQPSVYLDGVYKGLMDPLLSANTWVFRLDTRPYPDGDHKICVKAGDNEDCVVVRFINESGWQPPAPPPPPDVVETRFTDIGYSRFARVGENWHLFGRLTDKQGKGLENVEVEMHLEDPDPVVLKTTTKVAGTFAFEYVFKTAGKHVVKLVFRGVEVE